MPLLRKTGVRSPWMPAPLQASLERVLPAVVVAASMAMPGASVWMARPLDAGTPAPQEQIRPPLVLVNRPGMPDARVYQLTAPRVPQAAPLRPPLVGAAMPDPTLARPVTAWIGRIIRPEDTTRPPRPLVALIGAQPQIAGVARQIRAPRDHEAAAVDRAWPARNVSGYQLQPGAGVEWAGRLARPEDVDQPPRAARVRAGEHPVPIAFAVWLALPIAAVAPVLPTEPPFIGNAYIYDDASPTGQIASGTVLPNGPAPSPTGPITGGTVLPNGPAPSPTGPIASGTVLPNGPAPSPTGPITGGTVLPSETIYD